MQRIEADLRDCAVRAGARTGFGMAAGRISHADLDDLSERLAGALHARGITPGDRAVVFMEARPAAFVSAFAGLKAGAAICPVAPTATAEQLTFVLNNSCASCLFVDARLAAPAAAAMAEAPLLRLVVVCGAEGAPAIDGLMRYEDAVAADRAPLAPPGTEDDPALLLYALRPSGFPEATVVTHAEISTPASAVSGRPAGEDVIASFLTAVADLCPDRTVIPHAAA